MEARKLPLVEKAGDCKAFLKRGRQPRHKETAVCTWTVNSNGVYFQLGCSLLRLGGARKPGEI